MLFNNSICTITKVIKISLLCKKTADQNLFEFLQIEGLSPNDLQLLARSSGFSKRKAKKIEVVEFLTLMCLESLKDSPSYNDLAARFQTKYGKSPSKQAISKRINLSCMNFFQSVLAHIIKSKVPECEIGIFNSVDFKRILIQDSTIIRLPQKLFSIFSGVSNGAAQVCNARIQGVYDLVSGMFLSFSIDSYSKNDLVAAPELNLESGDLVLRDRGYFTISELKRHLNVQADFIFRYKFKTTFYDLQTGDAINLYNLLLDETSIDKNVALDKAGQTVVRLIAVPASDEVTNLRRMKAKKESHGHNPSKEYLEILAWTIFITSLPKEKADYKKIFMYYTLRWRIEIIFKCWKSHMGFSKVHNVSKNQLKTILYARFIMIVLSMHKIYNPSYNRILKYHNRQLSLFKLLKFLMKNPEQIGVLLHCNLKTENKGIQFCDQVLLKYCTYDHRKKRENFNQMFMSAFS